MRRFLSFLLLAAAGSGLAEAQPPEALVVTAWDRGTGVYHLVRVQTNGRTVATVAVLPSFTPYQITHGLDNRSYRIVGQGTGPGFPGVILDVDAAGRVTTVVASPSLKATALMIPTVDGDSLVLNRSASFRDTHVLRLRGGRLTTLSTVTNFGADGLTFDPETGALLVRGVDWRTTLVWGYYRVDPATGALTSFALPAWNIRNMGVGARRIPYEASSGGLIDLFIHPVQIRGAIVRVKPGRAVHTLSTYGLYSYPSDLVRAGGRAFPVQYRALMYHTSLGASFLIHVRGDGMPVGAAALAGLSTHQRTPMVRAGGNHLIWRLSAPPNGRVLRLSFPGEAGRPYVAGLSLNGFRPGPRLPDGREVPLVVDDLTRLCLGGGVPGIVQGTVGLLDGSGGATVIVDANPLGSSVKGLRVWAAVVVLDPGASSGVAHVVGPDVLVLR